MTSITTHAGAESAGDDTQTVSPLRVWPLRKPAVVMLAKSYVLLLAIWSVVGLLYLWLLDDGPVGDADRSVSRWFVDHRTDARNDWSFWGSMLSESYVKIGLIIVVGTIMVIGWRRWHDGVTLAVTVTFETLTFVITSFIVGRDRPPVPKLEEGAPSGSFPSGHAAAAVAFYVTLCIIIAWHTRNRWVRGVFSAIAVLAPIAVATARLYRGMHHLSDVIAGILLGVVSIIVCQRAMRAGVDDICADARDEHRALPEHVTRLDLTRTPGGTP